MKRIASIIAVLSLALLCVSSASAQTTYNQTNHVCELYQCTLKAPAEFDPPASLSYFLPAVFNALNQGKTNITFTNQYAYWCTGSLTCTQTEYKDADGTLVRTYHGIDPNCPVSVSCWELKFTFNVGQSAADEKWQCSRSCGSNDSGSVTTSGSSRLIYPCGSEQVPCKGTAAAEHKPGTCWWDGKGADWMNIECVRSPGIVLSGQMSRALL